MLGYPKSTVAVQMEFHEWLSWFLQMHDKLQQTEICITMWALWFAHIRMIHEGKIQSVGEIVNFVRSYVGEWSSIPVLRNGPVVPVQIRWSFPPAGLIKVNFDARYRFNHRTATTGIVIRDEFGEILGSCCRITYPVLSVFVAEARAVMHELRFAKELGFLNVMIKIHQEGVS